MTMVSSASAFRIVSLKRFLFALHARFVSPQSVCNGSLTLRDFLHQFGPNM